MLNQYDGRARVADNDEWELYLLEHHLSTNMSEAESKDRPFGSREYMRIVNK
jgi:hypothetical protein